jgi:hypothetical protein
MNMRFMAFVAFAGCLAFSILFIADQEIKAGLDRLAEVKIAPRHVLDADPDLKLVTERNPYMGDDSPRD